MIFRVPADVFVPAGGRPSTLRGDNWRSYVREGQPASKVIVEGANLFITPEARAELSKLGVVIVKDSSANKCGVICSSYEIAGCMLLSTEEFIEVKPVFVQQVLERLRPFRREERRRLRPGDLRGRDSL